MRVNNMTCQNKSSAPTHINIVFYLRLRANTRYYAPLFIHVYLYVILNNTTALPPDKSNILVLPTLQLTNIQINSIINTIDLMSN